MTPPSDRIQPPTGDGSDSELTLHGGLSILRRYARFAVMIGLSAGLLVHLGTSIWAARAKTTYQARFEVRYRVGTSIMAGLSRLVGRDLPSVSARSSIETQIEILRSRNVRLSALRRIKAYSELSDEDLEAKAAQFQTTQDQITGTDIISVSVVGYVRDEVQLFAEGLLAEYRAQDVRAKRQKDMKLQGYVQDQIRVQEQKLTSLFEVLTAHKQVAPLEEQRDRAKKQIASAEETLLQERRSRRNKRDALLSKYTPDHPLVIQAEEDLNALGVIAGAEAAKDLEPFLGGGEAQWAALRSDIFEETRRREALEARIGRVRFEIGERFKDLLRAGSDPEHVQREYRLAQETYEGLRRRLNQIELSIQDKSSDIETLSEPDVRDRPTTVRWQWSLAVALLFGFLSPFVLESLMVTSHTVEDLERASGLPALAMVPQLDEASTNGNGLFVRGSAASDELRLLRTNIESALDYPARRVILVAGAEPGEGKSMIAANLAAVYAEMGVPTLLVDLDLRRPVAHKLLKVRLSPGVTEVIRGEVPWKRAVQIPGIDNLHVLPAGQPVEDSGGLLATVRLAEVLSEMREVFSVVICDSPALTAVADASLVARRADAVVLVYALATTPHRSLQRTVNMLRTTRANVVGVVANDVRGLNSKKKYRYRHYYENR